jgi:hypothetical protein
MLSTSISHLDRGGHDPLSRGTGPHYLEREKRSEHQPTASEEPNAALWGRHDRRVDPLRKPQADYVRPELLNLGEFRGVHGNVANG